MELKFKVVYGFDTEQEVSIGADELEKAYGLFLGGGRAVFKDGHAVDSKYIQAIRPDYHATMGWNDGHKMGADDYAQLSSTGIDLRLREAQEQAKQRVDYLIETGRTDLIGKNKPLKELE